MTFLRSTVPIALVLLLIGCGSPEEPKAKNKEKIIGVWVLTTTTLSSVPRGDTTRDFTKEGELIVTEKIDDEPLSVVGHYAVEGYVLEPATVRTAFIAVGSSKIKTLNDKDLVLEAKREGKNYAIELKREK